MNSNIKGYKALKKGLIDRYGNQLEINKSYTCKGELKFRQNGFHFCKNLEDTLRYVDSFNDEIVICEVIGSREFEIYEDDYYGYYDMYCAREIIITKILTYNEIISIIEKTNIERLKRFIQGYKLRKEEIEKYKLIKESSVKEFVEYYQEGNKKVFQIRRR